LQSPVDATSSSRQNKDDLSLSDATGTLRPRFSALTFTRFIKAVVMAMAAALYIPLVVDWCVPGAGLHEAVKALGDAAGTAHPPLWAVLVRMVGRDVAGLGTLSMLAALLCLATILIMAEDLVACAIRLARKRVTKTDASYAGVRIGAVGLTGLAFLLTPGFLRAATRIGPLMSLLLPSLVALALTVHVLTTVREDEFVYDRLKRGWLFLLTAVVLTGFSVWEMTQTRQLLAAEWPSFGLFFLIGLFPLLAFADLTRRWLLQSRRWRLWFFAGWAGIVMIAGVCAILSLKSGRVAERLARQIVRQASGCRAIVTDGPLDDLLVFLLPDGQRLISLSRDSDPAYGRELSDWLRGQGLSSDSDLVFAADLGSRAFVSEWRKCQDHVDATSSSRQEKEGTSSSRRDGDVASTGVSLLMPEAYFPTVKAWREGVAAIADMRRDEPLGGYLRRLLGVCGNHMACSRLEKGETEEAWRIFWEVLDRVDSRNYTVLINLSSMEERGYACTKSDKDRLKQLRDAVERDLQTPKHRQFAALSGGRLYVDPKVRARQEAVRKKALEKDEISPQARAFIETVSAATKDEESARRAREAIRKGVKQGLVRMDRIGDQLLTIDCMLEDWEGAEKDSLSVLRLERHHAMANATMGMLSGTRGDYLRAERFLRRALASESSVRCSTLNDLAFTLVRLKRPSEAEQLARQAVQTQPEDWNFRETLALALIAGGKPDEGERELAQAQAQAEKAGRRSHAIARFALDRAWLCRTRGEVEKLKIALRVLANRKDLTAPQKSELEELGR